MDTLTGDFTILRSDLVMDVGDSLNPAIDIGQVSRTTSALLTSGVCILHQVEGAFTQGLGLFTMEQCVYLEGNGRTQRGQLYTTGPGTYKIPACSDIPVQLNVTLLDETSNPNAIFSSKVSKQCLKRQMNPDVEGVVCFMGSIDLLSCLLTQTKFQAVGEPPLFLAASVLFAIRDAVRASREERGITAPFQLETPATCDAIRMACEDQFTQQVASYICIVCS